MDNNPGGSARGAKFRRAYRSLAIILLNTLLLVVGMNIVLGIALAVRERSLGVAGPASKWSDSRLGFAYPDISDEERIQLLKETWTRTFAYQDFTMFHEPPFSGKYVHVSAAGYRNVKDQGPWPPSAENLNVFVFGGSTTFGYGLPDWQTAPSCLQEALARQSKARACVYNFGSAGYYSSQERVALEKLLSDGHKPDVALFIDGVNECESLDDTPILSERFHQALDNPDDIGALKRLCARVPMVRMAQYLMRRPATAGSEITLDWATPEASARLRRAADKYRRNVSLIEAACGRFGVVPVFVWQPAPGYQYDLGYHLFRDDILYRKQEAFYNQMQRLAAAAAPASNFVWCADLQTEARECLYVDSVHYTAKFSKQFAEAIAAHWPDGAWRGTSTR